MNLFLLLSVCFLMNLYGDYLPVSMVSDDKTDKDKIFADLNYYFYDSIHKNVYINFKQSLYKISDKNFPKPPNRIKHYNVDGNSTVIVVFDELVLLHYVQTKNNQILDLRKDLGDDLHVLGFSRDFRFVDVISAIEKDVFFFIYVKNRSANAGIYNVGVVVKYNLLSKNLEVLGSATLGDYGFVSFGDSDHKDIYTIRNRAIFSDYNFYYLEDAN